MYRIHDFYEIGILLDFKYGFYIFSKKNPEFDIFDSGFYR